MIEPDGQFYRFAVKCGRDRFHQLEAQAKKSGVSLSAFVQMHFETIFDGFAPGKPGKTPEQMSISAEAERHGMQPAAIRVYRALKESVDEDGLSTIGVHAIALQSGSSEGSVRVLISKLLAHGCLRRVVKGGWRNMAVYRVMPLPEAAA